MIRVIATPEFLRTLDAALEHPDAPDRAKFLADDYLTIADQIAERWEQLLPSKSDPYRRTRVATYPPDDAHPRFYYSVRALLRPDGYIELENISIDWDYRPVEDSD
jgi:hypothetical protein